MKRYEKGGKVSDSEDVGTANARADRASIAQGEKDFGKNNSNIRGRSGTVGEAVRVSPLINVYPGERAKTLPEPAGERAKGFSRGGRVKFGSNTNCGPMCRDTKTIR